jgi:hypothetical protein
LPIAFVSTLAFGPASRAGHAKPSDSRHAQLSEHRLRQDDSSRIAHTTDWGHAEATPFESGAANSSRPFADGLTGLSCKPG